MDKTNITVTMSVAEYERLKGIEFEFHRFMRMFERANIDGTATFTDEIKQTIEDIYC